MIKKLKLIHVFKGTCHYPVTDKIGSQCYYSLKCSPQWEAPSGVLFLTYSDIGQIWSEFSLENLLDPLQQLGQTGSEPVI